MKKSVLIGIACATSFTAPSVWAQSQDMASERAKIANQRIQIEAARKAEEEKRRAELAAQQSGSVETRETTETFTTSRPAAPRPPPTETPASTQSAPAVTTTRPAPPRPPAEPATVQTEAPASVSTTRPAPPRPPADVMPASSDDKMTEMLDRIRSLGELRDAGYVSDEEFERIKKKILSDSL